MSSTFLDAARHAGSAATTAEQQKTANFTRCEQDVKELLSQAAHQLGARHGEASAMPVATCERLELQTISVALQLSNASLIRSRRAPPPAPQKLR
jgi:hypothetical protein